LYQNPADNVFKVRSKWLKPLQPNYSELEIPLIMKPNDKCFICRALLKHDDVFEVVLGVASSFINNQVTKFQRKKVLLCGDCLCTRKQLRDAQIISFGDGRKLCQNYIPNSALPTPEPEAVLHDFKLY